MTPPSVLAPPSSPSLESGARTILGLENRPTDHFSWARSLWFDVAIAVVVGSLYALAVMGPAALNPRNIDWLTPDPAYHFIGWELFRQDHHVHWPLTYTDRIGYPYGESVALIDLNPLLAVLLKPLSSILPEPFQYLGLEVALCCVLQLFFALRLLRLLLGTRLIAVPLSSIFFVLSPPLNFRLVGHYSLSNHWLLVAALFVFFLAQADRAGSLRRWIVWAVTLATIAIAINPYLAFQVLAVLAAAGLALMWRRRFTLGQTAAFMAALGIVPLAVAYFLGFIIAGGRGYSSGGYRYYSLNLLSVLDPQGFGARIMPPLHQATAGQYEGYNYLGAGALLLACIAIVLTLWRRKKSWTLDIRWFFPLMACCALLTLMALTTKVTLGSHTLIDLDTKEKVSALLAPLRATGRLFWLPYYALLTGILVAPHLYLRKSWANVIIAATLVLQFIDTVPLRYFVHTEVTRPHPTPLKSPIWSKLGSVYDNLIVLPAWQCDALATPGEKYGYRYFGYLAVEQQMRTNSYNSARYTQNNRDRECTEAITALSAHPLASDSAYVVAPAIAAIIAEGPTGPGKCHDLDTFILCSPKTDFGLSPTLATADERAERSIGNAGFEDKSIFPWQLYLSVKASLTARVAHSGSHSLAETDGEGSLYQDVNDLQPGRVYTVSAWVSGTPNATATAQLAIYDPGSGVATFSALLTPVPVWQRLSQSITATGKRSIRIHLFRNQGTGTLYWDDVRIFASR